MCKIWCDAKLSQIKKHKSGNKHKEKYKNLIDRNRKIKYTQENNDQNRLLELNKIRKKALVSFKMKPRASLIGTFLLKNINFK